MLPDLLDSRSGGILDYERLFPFTSWSLALGLGWSLISAARALCGYVVFSLDLKMDRSDISNWSALYLIKNFRSLQMIHLE